MYLHYIHLQDTILFIPIFPFSTHFVHFMYSERILQDVMSKFVVVSFYNPLLLSSTLLIGILSHVCLFVKVVPLVLFCWYLVCLVNIKLFFKYSKAASWNLTRKLQR